MNYGFNDKKNKVKMVAESDLVRIDKLITRNTTGQFSFSINMNDLKNVYGATYQNLTVYNLVGAMFNAVENPNTPSASHAVQMSHTPGYMATDEINVILDYSGQLVSGGGVYVSGTYPDRCFGVTLLLEYKEEVL